MLTQSVLALCLGVYLLISSGDHFVDALPNPNVDPQGVSLEATKVAQFHNLDSTYNSNNFVQNTDAIFVNMKGNPVAAESDITVRRSKRQHHHHDHHHHCNGHWEYRNGYWVHGHWHEGQWVWACHHYHHHGHWRY